MKKPIRRILIVLSIILALFAVCGISYWIMFKKETGKMTPISTMKITENVYTIHDSFVNIFLIQDSNSYIAIDAGANIDSVAAGLKKLHIAPEQIKAVLLTHTHADHVAAIKLFKNASIYLSKQEEQMINGETSVFLGMGNKIDTKLYSLIEDKQIITIGQIQIKGILTPGHTPGSMSYLINDKFLFVGDALSLQNKEVGEFNNTFNMDSETAIKSIEKIKKLTNIEYLFTAHYGYRTQNN